MPVGGLIPHTTSKVPYAPRYSTLLVGSCTCMPVPMSRGKESSAGWSAGRSDIASWRLSSNDVHVHVSYGPYGPYLTSYVNDGSCDFGLILVRTWDLGKVTFPVVGKCKVCTYVGVYMCVYGCVYGYGIYGRYKSMYIRCIYVSYLTLGLP